MCLQNEVKDIIKSFVGQTNILTVPRILVEYMENDLYGGIMLSQILYWSSRTSNKDGWFYKSYSEWFDEICISEYQARKVIKTLKEKEVNEESLKEKGIENTEILETKVKRVNGNPTVHYRLNFDVFSESLLKFLSNETEKFKSTDTENFNEPKLKNLSNVSTKNSVSYKAKTTTKITSKNTTKTSKQTPVRSQEKGFDFENVENSTINNETSFADEASSKLYNSLMEKRKIMRKNTNLKLWSSTIDTFISESIVTLDEFTEVLNWYVVHLGERYIPQAYSAQSFCDKFVKITDAMGFEKNNKKPMTRYDKLMAHLEGQENG